MNDQYYLRDANFILKSILRGKIIKLSQQQRADLTIDTAKQIKAKYLELKDWYGNDLKQREIYEQACNQVACEIAQRLKPPETNKYRTLSEQLEDEEADT
jgi:hypothetical protein